MAKNKVMTIQGYGVVRVWEVHGTGGSQRGAPSLAGETEDVW